MRETDEELVTVVIPARNEVRHDRWRASTACSARPTANLQVLVVDGDSTDGTRDARSAGSPRPTRGSSWSTTRDRAIPLRAQPRGRCGPAAAGSSGSTPTATDPRDYVERVVASPVDRGLRRRGRPEERRGYTAAGRAIAAVMGSKFGQGNSVYHYGTEPTTVDHVPFGAYPVDVVRELGGWSETQLVNEDYEFDYRLRQSRPRVAVRPGDRDRLGLPPVGAATFSASTGATGAARSRRSGASRVGRGPPPGRPGDGGRPGRSPWSSLPFRRTRWLLGLAGRARISGWWRPGPSPPGAGRGRRGEALGRAGVPRAARRLGPRLLGELLATCARWRGPTRARGERPPLTAARPCRSPADPVRDQRTRWHYGDTRLAGSSIGRTPDFGSGGCRFDPCPASHDRPTLGRPCP